MLAVDRDGNPFGAGDHGRLGAPFRWEVGRIADCGQLNLAADGAGQAQLVYQPLDGAAVHPDVFPATAP
jgi:hypothetical protein